MTDNLLSDDDDFAPEDIISLVTLNRIRQTKIKVSLKDEKGDTVDLTDVVKDLTKYVREQLSDGDSKITNQISPLMSHTLVSSLGRNLGAINTSALMASSSLAESITRTMITSFLLLKYIQKHKLTIVTHEEPISTEELDALDRRAKANSVAVFAALTGHDPIATLEELRDKGEITEEDFDYLTTKRGRE